jgi:two-component system chemotaxis response regulator CheB
VVTLDLVMPELDGLGLLAALKTLTVAPRVVVVTMSDAESELGLAALEAGAVDLVHKPTAIATDRLYELGAELVRKVLIAAEAKSGGGGHGHERAFASKGSSASSPRLARAPHTRLLAIGASTGGPQAITRVIGDLPGDFTVPVAIVLHMPAGYTQAIAERLTKNTHFDVREGEEGMLLPPGRIVIARAGVHLKVVLRGGELVCHLDRDPPMVHCPAVDELFRSAGEACGDRALAVILTGMGVDGLDGARSLHARGGRILAESADSAVVDGMPRVVREAGLAFREAALNDMAAAIVASL